MRRTAKNRLLLRGDNLSVPENLENNGLFQANENGHPVHPGQLASK
jgi:hypothetical protein